MSPKPERFPCQTCGAWLEFQAGEHKLRCPYCGGESQIERKNDAILEQDFSAWLQAGGAERVATYSEQVIPCGNCGAETTSVGHTLATACAYCGTPLIAQGREVRVIRPKSLLPFVVDQGGAKASLRRWVEALWFAPSDLRRSLRDDEPLQGIYLPYWTFDAYTRTHYEGRRGDDYWDTESYTTTVNGRSERRTRSVRRTRWRSARGTVDQAFDDVLVPASRSLPQARAIKLEPWDLRHLVPYDESYLAGFRAELYQVGLAEGFEVGKARMRPVIESAIRSDIGGDHQDIQRQHTEYYDVSFKHLLLPVWLSSYRYRNRTFQFVINAQTGEVQGDRPYSTSKIVLTVALGLLVVALIVLLVTAN